jgi:hypothetical protein
MRLLILGMILSGCQPNPRSPSYFEGHPEEAQRIIRACTTGAQRGNECDTATAGLAAHRTKQRQDLFKKSFE